LFSNIFNFTLKNTPTSSQSKEKQKVSLAENFTVASPPYLLESYQNTQKDYMDMEDVFDLTMFYNTDSVFPDNVKDVFDSMMLHNADQQTENDLKAKEIGYQLLGVSESEAPHITEDDQFLYYAEAKSFTFTVSRKELENYLILFNTKQNKWEWKKSDNAHHGLEKLLKQQSEFPPQIAFAAKRTSLRAGALFKKFYCSGCTKAGAHRDRDATRFEFNISMYDLINSLMFVQCSVIFEIGFCKHKKGTLYGQTRGNTRKEMMQSIKPPRHITQDALQTVSGQQILTGNRQSVPSVGQARKIKQEKRTFNLAQQVMETITKINHKNAEIWKAKNPNHKQRLVGIIQDPIQLSPLCINIYNEPALAFYHHFAGSNPGVYLDYTGSLVHTVPKYLVEQASNMEQFNTYSRQRVLNALMVMPTGDSRIEETAPVIEIMEIVTSDLKASNLQYCLQKFRKSEENLFGHKTVPYLFNADCAKNILVAVLQEYNNETTMEYLSRITRDLINNKSHDSSKVQVAWCFSHAVKAVRNHLRATKFVCHPGIDKQFLVKAGVRLWNLVRVRKSIQTAENEAKLWHHLLNQRQLKFEDTILVFKEELDLMNTSEKFDDVYGENEDDDNKNTVSKNICFSDDELDEENQWLIHQEEIKDFDITAFPQVTVTISTPPPPVTTNKPPKVNFATYTHEGQDVIRIIKHKTDSGTEYELEFPTLSIITKAADFQGYLLNPLYSPEFCQYLAKCWWKTVILWGNLTTKVRERHRRTTATVEVAHNVLKTFDIRSRNLDLPQYLEKRVETIYGNQLLAGEKMAQASVTPKMMKQSKIWVNNDPKEGWNRDLPAPLSAEDAIFLKDFKEAYSYARQYVKKTQNEIGKDIGNFAADGKPVSQSALSKVLTRNEIPGSHRIAIESWVKDQLERKKAQNQLVEKHK
jgi:hypothetical protein